MGLFAILGAMTPAALRRYCLSRPGAVAEYPFGPGPRVYKVGNKMFALIPDDPPLSISLKCDPALAEILRERFDVVTPAYHFNKRHWNGIAIDGSVPDALVREWIDDSYALVVKSLSRVERERLGLGVKKATGR